MKRRVPFYVGLVILVACAASPVESTVTVTQGLDGGAYKTEVHHVFEAACGKTTCHGKLPRGLRVYGATALPLAERDGPHHRRRNHGHVQQESIEGLEPEKLNAFLGSQPRTKDEAYKLLVLAKPLQLERHRPGVSLRKGEPAEACITSWLLGNVDEAACAIQEAQQ